MAEQLVKIFGKEIQKNLFPDNSFYKNSRLDGGVNVKAKTIQVPQSGSAPTVLVNPSSFPLTIAQRTDDTIEYSVDLFATAPIHIEDVNLMVINYDKRKDVLEDHVNTLNTAIANKMAYTWAAGLLVADGNVLKTTGAARPSTYGGVDVKKVTYNDIVALSTKMDEDEIPEDGRFLLVPSQMYADLLGINEFISVDYKDKAVAKGSVGTILGFTIYKRSKAVKFNATFVLKAYTDANATTDRDGILAWQKSFVRRAEGTVKVYSEIDKPTYLGSIYNAAVRSGGVAGRSDNKGVYSLAQETA